jgi:hypothetical protein
MAQLEQILGTRHLLFQHLGHVRLEIGGGQLQLRFAFRTIAHHAGPGLARDGNHRGVLAQGVDHQPRHAFVARVPHCTGKQLPAKAPTARMA